MAFGNLDITIYDTSSVSQGTIGGSKVLDFGCVSELDAIGSGYFVIAADDTQSRSILAENFVAVMHIDMISVSTVMIQQFIIQDIDDDIGADGRAVLRVSGDDLLHELTYENLAYDTISDGSGGPSSSGIADILGYSAQSWRAASAGSNFGKLYYKASGESPWQALLDCYRHEGAHIALNNYAQDPGDPLPNYELIAWYDHLAGSGIFDWDAVTLKLNPTTGNGEIPILDIDIIKQRTEAVTRAYIFGAGMGEDRFTLAEVTASDPAGFTTTAADSLIVNTTLEAVTDQPSITRVKQFAAIKPEDDTTTAKQSAANALHQAGIEWLRERDGSDSVFYVVKTIPDGTYFPGQLVTLTYTRTSPYDSSGSLIATDIITINDTFILLKLEYKWNNNKNAIDAIMTLGDVSRQRPNGDKFVAHKLHTLEQTLRHATAGQSKSTPSGDGIYLRADGSPPNLTGNMVVGAGVTIDGVDISAFNAAQFVTMATSAEMANERVLTAGDGLDRTDGGAGSTVTLAVDVTDLLGNGITESANNITLGTPSTLTVSTSNGVTASSHTHAITSSSAVSTSTAVLLATNSSGRVRVQGLGVGTAATGTGVLDLATRAFINDTANTNQTIGLTINQGANDDEIITLKSSDVAHGVTDLTETDTFGTIGKSANGDTPATGFNAGGLLIRGYRDADADPVRALALAGVLGEAASTGTTLGSSGSLGVVHINALIKSGTGTTSVADDGNLLAVTNSGATVWLAKGDGRIYQTGTLFVNDNANTNTTIGLTINQGAADDEIITLKSSDVAHGMTNFTETDTFGLLKKRDAAAGGLTIESYSDSNTEPSAMLLLGHLGGAADTTKSATGYGVVRVAAGVKSGTGRAQVGANGNLFSIDNLGSTRWIVDAEGDTHRDGTDNTFDDYEDAQLARVFDRVVSPGSVIDSEFDGLLQYGRDDLIAAGVLHESGFYNESRLLRLAIGAAWQEYVRGQKLAQRIEALEQELLHGA